MKLHEMTYLVVDDLELMRAVTVNQLRALGCEKVKSARNGAMALDILRNNKIDVVLCDWNMPVMSGLDLLKIIRADPKLVKLPFLMITAEAERQRIEEVIHAGVSGLLVKPYNAGNLRNRLEKVLSSPSRPLAPGGGSATAPIATQPNNRRATDTTLAPSRILVVDDYPVTLKLLEQMFKDEYQVVTASDGLTALALCRADPTPDLLLMDVKMPGMDGFEVVRQLHTQTDTAQIPVIFVTGATDEDTRMKGMELGAVDFVLKTSDPKALRAKVRNFIKYIDMRRKLQADFDAMLDASLLREDVENTTRHDIKGSLAGIVGMVQSLADDDTMAPRHVEKLRLVEKTAQQVMDMVNLSGELYKMETGNFKLKAVPVNVGDILHRIVDVSRSTFFDKGLTIEVDTDTPVGTELPQALGDTNLCYSLFQNLIKNACEAAPHGSRVVVALRDEAPLRIEVSNTGVVPAEMRDHFFDKYATSGKTGGSGIGTYSAQLLAKAQKGTMAMRTSDTDNHTIITVTLPRHTFDPAHPSA
ncbi:hybrid sensor histidine kinase/response regulator [Rhodoferax sp.]|uniref:ATP-binding response regulator n=1 Tax=Rhodoferax sp. TaxID=50421 RepID=UPI0026137EF9|nr:hybrid sensor histidine kinase/response regulator [Rhodoferax sp.]MDD2809399.1 hybrid sensor histidine kinase/response regulator [Rhodoferax sp.]MDD4942996.1 hybrid sensor histidine kinase/response regulator [Rhodoferax sp.]MDD5480425.1 hybrid sensor histidine kinase/response regulator [Rhodoferax sp.]